MRPWPYGGGPYKALEGLIRPLLYGVFKTKGHKNPAHVLRVYLRSYRSQQLPPSYVKDTSCHLGPDKSPTDLQHLRQLPVLSKEPFQEAQ